MWTIAVGHTYVVQFILLLIVLFGFTVCENSTVNSSRSTDLGSNITKILNAFFSSGYDKRVRPNYGGPPVTIGVTMFVISISTVSEVQMDFTSDFYFRQSWRDPRLSFKPLPQIKDLFVGAEVAERIWVPDTFFANEKSAYFHIATTKNTFLRIRHNGEVLRSIRLTVTASCPMDLQYFPMDRQTCSIEIESYGYSMADIRYTWQKGDKSVGLGELKLPQFRVAGHRQKEKVINLTTGNYSRLICEIQFVRSLGFYLIQIYIPASLIVVISWVSFWLHRNATPARVALGVTTVLTMTTLMSSTNAQLPKISYIKSIDVFLGTCFVMVFASLVEYATVGYLGKRIAMRKSRVEQMAKMAEEQRKKIQGLSNISSNEGSQPNSNQPSAQHLHQPPPPLLQHPPQLPHHQHQQHQPQQQQQLQIQDIPPPIPPAPTGIVNPNICPMTINSHSPRQMVYKHAHIYHPGGGTLHRTHYDRYPCSSPPSLHTNTCTPVRTCTPTHIICTHPENMSTHYPGDLRFKSQQHQSDTKGLLAPTRGISSENPTGANTTGTLQRRSMDPETPSTPAPAQSGGGGGGGGGGGPFGRCKNPNKLLGISPSDIDKYSRVIFPVCFVCFNLMYWIIYLHISDDGMEGLVPLGST